MAKKSQKQQLNIPDVSCSYLFAIVGRYYSIGDTTFIKYNKYKTYESAKQALVDLSIDVIGDIGRTQTHEMKIVPYFNGYVYNGN